MEQTYDVAVVGAGNAALCAALSAREHGARVLVLERAPRHARGGNSYFTGGLVRCAYADLDELRGLVPDLTDAEAARIELDPYPPEELYADLGRVTDWQADPELGSVLATQATPTLHWMRERGVRFALALGRQAFASGGVFRFWGRLPLEIVGGGPGLVDALFDAATRQGVDIWYGARAKELRLDAEGRIRAVAVRRDGERTEVATRAVVLASGGFEANPEMRARYLGPDWDVARVRGSEFNTGDGIAMALAIGARPHGHWSGCHAVAWDANAPPTGDRVVGDGFQKHSYPFGIVVNKLGRRFVDEGADFRNFTYAKYGKEILRQPDRIAFQLFDSKVSHLLRDEYRIAHVTKAEADSLEELARALEIAAEPLARTVAEFNAATSDAPFDPTRLDGKGTRGIDPPKSNWAQPLDKPPYLGFPVTCGITFTFGGLQIDADARVIDTDGEPIPGLFAAGELVGGLFYHNYPGGCGLAAGAVFGRIAGRSAAASARGR